MKLNLKIIGILAILLIVSAGALCAVSADNNVDHLGINNGTHHMGDAQMNLNETLKLTNSTHVAKHNLNMTNSTASGNDLDAVNHAIHAAGKDLDATTKSTDSNPASGNNLDAKVKSTHAAGSDINATTKSIDSNHAAGSNLNKTANSNHAAGSDAGSTAKSNHAAGNNLNKTTNSTHAAGNNLNATTNSTHAAGNSLNATAHTNSNKLPATGNPILLVLLAICATGSACVIKKRK